MKLGVSGPHSNQLPVPVIKTAALNISGKRSLEHVFTLTQHVGLSHIFVKRQNIQQKNITTLRESLRQKFKLLVYANSMAANLLYVEAHNSTQLALNTDEKCCKNCLQEFNMQ